MNIVKGQQISFGDECFLDFDQQVLIKDKHHIALSRIQFRLLQYLAMNIGKIIPSEELISYVWGTNCLVNKDELYVYINRVRNRLEDNPRKPKCLLSLRGTGYILYPRKKN